jgi:hypothetical protein
VIDKGSQPCGSRGGAWVNSTWLSRGTFRSAHGLWEHDYALSLRLVRRRTWPSTVRGACDHLLQPGPGSLWRFSALLHRSRERNAGYTQLCVKALPHRWLQALSEVRLRIMWRSESC